MNAQATTRAHGRSFYLASHLLGPDDASTAYVLYALLRHFDDAVDEPRGVDPDTVIEQGRRFLSALRAGTDAADIVDERILPVADALAFASLVKKHALPIGPLEAFFNGLQGDLRFEQPEEETHLRLYCYRVAGTVGEMMAWLFGVRDETTLSHARDLGEAMQLTNILRDVREDLQRGRVYLPLSAFHRFGVTKAALEASEWTLNVRAMLGYYVEQARRLYGSAMLGVDHIPGLRRRMTVSAMARVYGGILDELEARDMQDGPRATVSTARRLGLLATGVLETAVWRQA
jgi:phytoene synthase